jgi:hypothetical protein
MEEIQKKSKLKKLKKIALLFGAFFFVLIVTAFVLANVYEKEIKQYAIEEINSQLKAQLKVNEDNVSFSFLKRFPKASLSFKDLLIEGENKKDTILFAQNFSLEFGLGSIFSGNYTVNEVDLDDAIVNLIVEKNGDENYIFWKGSESADTTESNLQFKLNEVNFNNVALKYLNKRTKIKADVVLNKTVFAGDFSNDSTEISISSSHYIIEVSNDSTIYFKDKKSKLAIEKGFFSSDIISLTKGSISIEEMDLDVNCDFYLKKKKSVIKAVASKVEISDVFSLMPNKVAQELKDYATKGKVNGTIEITSKKNQKSPTITAEFSVADGTITEQKSGVQLTNLKLDGNYSSSTYTQRIEVITGSGNLSGGAFTLNGKIIGKNSQTIVSNLKGDFDLKKLVEFLKVENIESVDGSISLNNQFRGTKQANNKLRVTEFTGTAKLSNASMKLKDVENSFENFVGDVTFNRFNSDAKFTGNFGKSDFLLSSQFSNFIPYLFYNEELKANVYLQSEVLELDKFLGNNKASVDKGEDTTGVKLPENINATLRANITKLIYQKHDLTNLSGTLFVGNDKVKTTNLKFDGNGGSYSLEGELVKRGEQFDLTSKIICGQVMINDFLEKFNNFGQTTLRHEHLSGRANALISMKAKMSKHLKLDLNTLDANMEFSISKGILKNFELFDEIGEYLKANAISRSIVKVDELSKKLKTVHFSEFTNTVIIKDRKITIPNMFVKTSAMDIGLYGTQTFEDEINYGLNLRLTDILTKKKDTEYGYIVDDGTGVRLFLLMTGTIEEPVFKLDKEARKDHNQQQREEEKNNIKNILKDEFGLFKKDTSVTSIKPKEKAKPKFEVDWGEEKKELKADETKTQVQKKEEKKPEEKTKRQKWLDKLKGKEEKKDKVGFEVE